VGHDFEPLSGRVIEAAIAVVVKRVVLDFKPQKE
jgi:hypothetical protein